MEKQNIYDVNYEVELDDDFLDENNNFNIAIEFTTHWQMGKELRQIHDSIKVPEVKGTVEEEISEEEAK